MGIIDILGINYAQIERDLANRYSLTPHDIWQALNSEMVEGRWPVSDGVTPAEAEDMRDTPLTIEIDLLPEDANAIRLKLHYITMQGLIWQTEMTRLSNLMSAVLGTKSPTDAMRELVRQGRERAANNNAMIMSFVQDFRTMLLTSPDLPGETLEEYLPEYKGRWRYVESQELPLDPGVESGGSDGNPEGVGGS